MASVYVFERRVSHSSRSSGTTNNQPQHRPSEKSKVQAFHFEEYEHPQTQNEILESGTAADDNDVGQLPTQAIKPVNDITDKTRRPRATKAWKIVDSKAILTRRKYIRKGSKSTGAGEHHDDCSTSARQIDSGSPNTRQISNCQSPGGGKLQGEMFDCFPLENRPCIQEAMDYCEEPTPVYDAS
jgi:hypothetical protein